MCYSKEVTFAVGTLMTISSAYTWNAFVRNNDDPLLKPAFKNILFGYLCIALHQFGDSFSILTGSQIIYKLGLIASITCMFFYMRSLEALSKISFGSNIFAIIIALCALHIMLTPLSFENLGFWVRGDKTSAYLVWSTSWLALFIYWNVCLLYFRKITVSPINRHLLVKYGMYSINISFILYNLYAYSLLLIKSASLKGLVNTWDLFKSFDLVMDSPSIWCVFSVTQAFLIPLLFKQMSEKYKSQGTDNKFVSWKTRFQLVAISFCFCLVFLFVFPTLLGAALKMVG